MAQVLESLPFSVGDAALGFWPQLGKTLAVVEMWGMNHCSLDPPCLSFL